MSCPLPIVNQLKRSKVTHLLVTMGAPVSLMKIVLPAAVLLDSQVSFSATQVQFTFCKKLDMNNTIDTFISPLALKDLVPLCTCTYYKNLTFENVFKK